MRTVILVALLVVPGVGLADDGDKYMDRMNRQLHQEERDAAFRREREGYMDEIRDMHREEMKLREEQLWEDRAARVEAQEDRSNGHFNYGFD